MDNRINRILRILPKLKEIDIESIDDEPQLVNLYKQLMDDDRIDHQILKQMKRVMDIDGDDKNEWLKQLQIHVNEHIGLVDKMDYMERVGEQMGKVLDEQSELQLSQSIINPNMDNMIQIIDSALVRYKQLHWLYIRLIKGQEQDEFNQIQNEMVEQMECMSRKSREVELIVEKDQQYNEVVNHHNIYSCLINMLSIQQPYVLVPQQKDVSHSEFIKIIDKPNSIIKICCDNIQ